MDSYRALLAASSIEIEENSSRYANPLRQLKKALGKTGSTVILLHHSSIASSQTLSLDVTEQATPLVSTACPIRIITLKWLADAGADGNRKDSPRGDVRLGPQWPKSMPDQLIGAITRLGLVHDQHGETGDALLGGRTP